MKPGSKLKNGATVLAFKGAGDKRVVLAHWEHNSYTPYVTWRLDPCDHTFLGHYFAEIGEATADFAGR
jgi:hypothetical protein